MEAQAVNLGGEIVKDTIIAVALGERPFACRTRSGDVFPADAVIIATGAQARWLGYEPSDLQGRGIGGCATCDGVFFRRQHVAVIGRGNTAVEEALYMANTAASVKVIHRRVTLRADQILQNRLFTNPKISLLRDTGVDHFLGDRSTGLTGLQLRSSDGTLSELSATGAFVAIGHDPATAMFKGQIELDPAGYIVTAAKSTATSVAGVFEAGDVQDSAYRQTAPRQGRVAWQCSTRNVGLAALALRDGCCDQDNRRPNTRDWLFWCRQIRPV